MVGRFVDHDGGPTNLPAARFGNISIGPSKIRSELGKYVDTICLDTNSRTGFSGSPVYVYRTMTCLILMKCANPSGTANWRSTNIQCSCCLAFTQANFVSGGTREAKK